MKRSVITSNKHGISELRHDMPDDARLRMLRPRTQDSGCYGKRHVKIFPAGGDPAPPSRKITFHGRIQRDVSPAEKVVPCCRPKTRHMLGENCPAAAPTTNDSSMSLAEQSDIPGESAAPAQPESSVETQISTEPQQTPSPTQWEAGKESSSVDDGSGSDFDSGSSSESGDESGSEMESSSGSVAPSESSPDLPSRENLSVVQEVQVNQKQDSQKPGTASEEPQLHLRREIKLKRKLLHLTLEKQKNRYLKKREH